MELALINQLQTDVQTLVTAYNLHTHAGVTTGPGTSGVSGNLVFQLNLPPGTINAGQGQASDGSTVAPKSGNQKVLSKRTLVR